ncbi:monofunctional biosynthetic peptidoglycan transglycosylase [candidate division KSB1 bacterium]|nr:monofunctional biosynthetic peptidoglycan transglycosylase [candidate division KSB1 bacterium]
MGTDDPFNTPQDEQASLPDETLETKPEQRLTIVFKVLRLLGYGVGAIVVLSILLVLIGRWMPPITTSFMIQQSIVNKLAGNKQTIRYRWTSWKEISPHVALAIVAAEDQKFPDHSGFDFQAIAKAQQENRRRKQPRGASTITQQVAKNLYLWPGRSYLRKTLEVYFTILLELLWSKKRILEVYLNIAEFAPNIYGVGAAAEEFWHKKPADLMQREAALLAAVLPNPKRLHADRPSLYVEERIQWIEINMRQLGESFLKDL